MIGLFLGSVVTLFFVMSVPALMSAPVSTIYIARNFAAAVFISFALVCLRGCLPAALFLSGVIVCGIVAFFDRREAAKLLCLEAVMIALMIPAVILIKEDAGGLFSGRGLRPTLEHLEGSLRNMGLPLRTEYFGLYSIGGLLGIAASFPLRPRVMEQLGRLQSTANSHPFIQRLYSHLLAQIDKISAR